MVLRRPKEPEPEAPDVEFVEELVRKSLEINAQLRNGDSTSRYLQHLRDQARAQVQEAKGVAPGKPAPGKVAAPTPSAGAAPQADRKLKTFSDFIHLKSDEFAAKHSDIRKRRAALDAEEAALQKATVDGLVDLLMVIADGDDVARFRSVLWDHVGFLTELGVRDVDLLKAAKRRG